MIKLHAEDVKDMLEQMSRLKVKSGWEFKLSYDYEFVNKYPDIVQRQQMLWEAKFKQLSSQLKMPPVDHKLAAQAAASTTHAHSNANGNTQGLCDVCSNKMTEMGSNTRPALPWRRASSTPSPGGRLAVAAERR